MNAQFLAEHSFNEEGYGDYDVEADTQDGETYSVRDEVLVFRQSKVVNIF